MPTVWFSTKYFQHAVCLGISRGVYFSIALTALFLKKFITVSASLSQTTLS